MGKIVAPPQYNNLRNKKVLFVLAFFYGSEWCAPTTPYLAHVVCLIFIEAVLQRRGYLFPFAIIIMLSQNGVRCGTKRASPSILLMTRPREPETGGDSVTDSEEWSQAGTAAPGGRIWVNAEQRHFTTCQKNRILKLQVFTSQLICADNVPKKSNSARFRRC